ncbi:MAG: hypothetical protein ABH864_00645 [archaeon]
MKRIYTYSLVVWVLFVILAIINGLVRDKYYSDSLSELSKYQVSSVVLVFVLLIVMYLFFRKFGAAYSNGDLWKIGFMWLVLTVAFEFVFGHYIVGHELGGAFVDYNIFAGRLQLLVLFFTLIGPWFVARNN